MTPVRISLVADSLCHISMWLALGPQLLTWLRKEAITSSRFLTYSDSSFHFIWAASPERKVGLWEVGGPFRTVSFPKSYRLLWPSCH